MCIRDRMWFVYWNPISRLVSLSLAARWMPQEAMALATVDILEKAAAAVQHSSMLTYLYISIYIYKQIRKICATEDISQFANMYVAEGMPNEKERAARRERQVDIAFYCCHFRDPSENRLT